MIQRFTTLIALCALGVSTAHAGLFGYDSREECVNKELQKYKQPNQAAENAVWQYCIDKFPGKTGPYRYEKLRRGKNATLTCIEASSKEKLTIYQREGVLTLSILNKTPWEVIENNRMNTMRYWNEYDGKKGKVRSELYIQPYLGYVHLTIVETSTNKSHLYIFDCRED